MLSRGREKREAVRRVAIVAAICVPLLFPRLLNADASVADRYIAAVVTLGPGPSLFTRFGHTAILIEDTTYHLEKLYNFGEFDYGDPALIRKFMTGRLRFWTSVKSFAPIRRSYETGVRALTVQPLDLSPTELKRLLDALRRAVRPENRYYTYNHYRANCTTHVRDLLDDITGGLLSRTYAAQSRTFRFHTRRSLQDAPLLQLFFDLILGARVDQPIRRFDAQYLPETFMADLGALTRADGSTLVFQTRQLYPDRRSESLSPFIVWGSVLFGLLILALPLAAPFLGFSPTIAARLFGVGSVVFGMTGFVIGVLLCVLWLLTPYADLHANQNLLIFLPTHLVWTLVGIGALTRGEITKRVTKLMSLYAAISAGLLGINLFLMVSGVGQRNLRFWTAAAVFQGILAAAVRAAEYSARR